MQPWVNDLDRVSLIAATARDKWLHEARPKQIPPPGNWDTLLILAGRFFGKSRVLTEHAWSEAYRIQNLRVHVLAPTIGDVRRVTFEGESGLLAKTPRELISDYNRSLHELTFVNGSKIIGFSVTEQADRLRGPQCHLLEFDEAAAADRPAGNLETAYKVASLGCRLPYPDGTPSRKIIATTPKPIPFLRNLARRPGVVVVRGTSHENLANVAPSIQNEILSLEGTAFGRQEIYGEFLDSTEHAIFKRSWFRLWPAERKLPEFQFIIQTMDTAFGDDNYDAKNQTSDYTASAVLGVFNTRQCFSDAELKKLGVKSKYAAVICDFWMERVGFPELLERTRKTYRAKWGAPGRRPDIVVIENKASGISLRQTLIQYGVPTWPFNPHQQGKTMRAHAASPLILQGMLFVPESDWTKKEFAHRKGLPRNWVEPLLDQMCAFAGEGSVEFDDGLDCIVQGMLYLSAQGHFHAEPEQRGFPDADEKEEADQRRAVEIAAREKRGRESHYGA